MLHYAGKRSDAGGDYCGVGGVFMADVDEALVAIATRDHARCYQERNELIKLVRLAIDELEKLDPDNDLASDLWWELDSLYGGKN